jgi:hypothetical protein
MAKFTFPHMGDLVKSGITFKTQHDLAEKIVDDFIYNYENYDSLNNKYYDNASCDEKLKQNLCLGKICLVAECQSGKTGLLIEITRRIKYYFRSKEKTFKYAIFQPCDNALKKQTEDRFKSDDITDPHHISEKGWLQNSLMGVYHTSNLKDFRNQWVKTKDKDDHFHLFIHDEAHRDASAKGTYDALAKQHDVPILSGPEKSNALLIYVTATPDASMICYMQQRGVRLYYLDNEEEYLSLKDIENSSRFRDIALPSIIKGSGKKSRNKEKQIADEVVPYVLDEYPNGGYLICRVGDKEKINKVIQSLKLKYPNYNFVYKIFGSSNTGYEYSIDDLDKELLADQDEGRFTFCFIKNSLRQGKTVDYSKLKNVVAWYDSTSTSANADNEAAVIQSVGRNCGYGKKNLKYRIWADRISIDKGIAFYEDMKIRKENRPHLNDGFNGLESKNAMSGTNSKHRIVEKTNMIIEICNSRNEAIQISRKIKAEYFSMGIRLGDPNADVSVVSMSLNKKDYAEDILNNVYTQFAFKEPNEGCGILYVDHCYDENDEKRFENWKKLSIEKPELIGKYIFAYKDGIIKEESVKVKGSGYSSEQSIPVRCTT